MQAGSAELFDRPWNTQTPQAEKILRKERMPSFPNPLRSLQRLIARSPVGSAGTATPELNVFVDEIAASLQAGRLTLVVGAGLSYGSGFPTWPDLLSNLAKLLVPPKELDAFNLLAVYDSPLISARFLKSRLAVPHALHSFVHEALYVESVDYTRANPTLDFVTSVVALAARTGAELDIITYNFDDLLEHAISVLSPPIEFQVVSLEEHYHARSYSIRILHVHGLLERSGPRPVLPPPFLILAEDEFHELMNNPHAWQNQAQTAAFAHRDCLFVGMSMTDPNLRRVLDFSARHTTASERRRWILARRYEAGDQLVDASTKMNSATADALNQIKADIFRSLDAKPIYLKGFSAYQNLAALVSVRS